MPDEIKSATTINQDLSGCGECGWPYGPDLTLIVTSAGSLVLCKNPWRCLERQMDLREHQEAAHGQFDAGK